MKTNKSYTKRIRVTKNGKLKAKKPGMNHFNAKQSRSSQTAIKRGQSIVMTQRAKRRFLPNT